MGKQFNLNAKYSTKINHFKQFLFLLWSNNTHLPAGGRVHWLVAAFRRMSKVIEKTKNR